MFVLILKGERGDKGDRGPAGSRGPQVREVVSRLRNTRLLCLSLYLRVWMVYLGILDSRGLSELA